MYIKNYLHCLAVMCTEMPTEHVYRAEMPAWCTITEVCPWTLSPTVCTCLLVSGLSLLSLLQNSTHSTAQRETSYLPKSRHWPFPLSSRRASFPVKRNLWASIHSPIPYHPSCYLHVLSRPRSQTAWQARFSIIWLKSAFPVRSPSVPCCPLDPTHCH